MGYALISAPHWTPTAAGFGHPVTNPPLWQRISGFSFEDAPEFAQRLGRENGWTHAQATAAIGEYKKFIYLVCMSQLPLAPSKAIDQVWHLHLIHTRSYWASFCDGVLGRPVHHEPAAAEAPVFTDPYAATRALYVREFGCVPMAEFWPPARERAAGTPGYWGCSG